MAAKGIFLYPALLPIRRLTAALKQYFLRLILLRCQAAVEVFLSGIIMGIKLSETVHFVYIALAAVIVFGVSGCNNDTNSEQTYYGSNTLSIVNEQVWLRNYSANRLSQAYEKSYESYDITVLSEYMLGEYSEEIGFGTINGGILNFTVNVPENLVGWDKLKVFFNIITEGLGWDVEIDDETTTGTFIEILTNVEDEYVLMREGVSGTNNSISDETVFFIYVNRDCTITGESKTDEQVMYTFNPFILRLKKGWNTIWYKQTYTTSGVSAFFMDIKNPDLKWVLISTVLTK
jgi:hypothetical protein